MLCKYLDSGWCFHPSDLYAECIGCKCGVYKPRRGGDEEDEKEVDFNKPYEG